MVCQQQEVPFIILMFVIRTDTPQERQKLDQQHLQYKHNQFHVSIDQAPAICSFIDNISYQIYKNKLSSLAKMITDFAKNCLSLSLSLNSFRKILELVKVLDEKVQYFSQYFQLIEAQIVQNFQQQQVSQKKLLCQSKTLQLNNIQTISQIVPCQYSPTHTLKKNQPQEQYLFTTIQTLLKQYVPKQLQPEEKTIRNLINSMSFIKQEISMRQSIGDQIKSSRTITDFSMVGIDVMSQQSLQGMISDQRIYQQERQTQLAIKLINYDESFNKKYKKNMKKKFMLAKLKYKRKN